MKIETLEEQCSSSSWQQQANSHIPDFEIDLRIEGVPGDLVQKDEKRINENLEKLRIGSSAESIREDLSKEDGDLTFSEETRRIIHDMGNVELFEFLKTTATVQCQFCF